MSQFGLEYAGGASAATTFVLDAGAAGAGLAARDLGSFCRGWFGRSFHCRGGAGGIAFVRKELAGLACGLPAAEFGGRTVQVAMGLGAGAVDGLLDVGEGGVRHGVELGLSHTGLNDRTAAETPGGVDHFGGERLFERSLRGEFLLEVPAEIMAEGFVFREHEIRGRVNAEGDGVAGGAGFAFFGARPGGGFGVAAVGGDLRFGCHGWSVSNGDVEFDLWRERSL